MCDNFVMFSIPLMTLSRMLCWTVGSNSLIDGHIVVWASHSVPLLMHAVKPMAVVFVCRSCIVELCFV